MKRNESTSVMRMRPMRRSYEMSTSCMRDSQAQRTCPQNWNRYVRMDDKGPVIGSHRLGPRIEGTTRRFVVSSGRSVGLEGANSLGDGSAKFRKPSVHSERVDCTVTASHCQETHRNTEKLNEFTANAAIVCTRFTYFGTRTVISTIVYFM